MALSLILTLILTLTVTLLLTLFSSSSSSSSVYSGRRMQLSPLPRSLIQVRSSSLKLYLTGWSFQNLSSLLSHWMLLLLTLVMSSKLSRLWQQNFLLISSLDGSVASFSEWPLLTVFLERLQYIFTNCWVSSFIIIIIIIIIIIQHLYLV